MENIENRLVDYITQAIKAGSSEHQIKSNLTAVGWTEEQIQSAYAQALINNGIPSPNGEPQTIVEPNEITIQKKNKVSAIDISINIISFILLAIVATATGVLFYQIINKYFPETLVNAGNSYKDNSFSPAALHYSIAVLVVAFPLYYLAMKLWFRGFQQDNDKEENDFTKFLTYVVLIVAVVVIVGSLIATVYAVLQGELTTRFFLKALTILMISGAIFGFYYLERKKVQYHEIIAKNVFKTFGMMMGFIILMGIVIGLIAGGSPSTTRQRGFDAQRVQDLDNLYSCVDSYARKYKQLPDSLADVTDSSFCKEYTDPVSDEEYGYRVITNSQNVGSVREAKFELCATFALPADENINDNSSYYSSYGRDLQWNDHTAGENCKVMTIVLEKEAF
jgi:hypothetical protein